MILKSISVTNYRPYHGSFTIEFAEGDKNITIIEGSNDKGKTSLLNAFTWCLYGQESYKKEGKESIWNRTAFNNISIGETLDVIVEIIMKDNENNNIIFKRKQTCQKLSQNDRAIQTPVFKIFKNDGINDIPIDNPTQYIETHLPYELREYYLFDGEQLVQFFNKDSKSVKKAVFNLSQLNLLDRSEEHISKFRVKLIENQTNIAPKLAEYQKQKIDLEKLQKNLKSKIEEHNETITYLKNKNVNLANKIKEFDSNSEELYNKKEELKEEVKNLEENLKNLNISYTKYLTNNINYILANSLLKDFDNRAKVLEDKGFIPAKYKKEFLEDLLKRNICICGTRLDENSDCYNTLQELINKTDDVTNISENVNQLLSICRNIKKKYPKNMKDTLRLKQSEIITLENEISYKKTQIQEINVKLESIPIDMIKENNAKISKNEKEIENLYQEIGKFKDRSKNIPNKINTINIHIAEEESNQEIHNRISNQLIFCEKLQEICSQLNYKMKRSIHNKLQKLTSEEFKQIHWKKSYKDVLINDDFEVSFVMKDGSEKSATDPSSGSQLVLALSFVIALNSLSGFKLPIIIDTPMGRLDSSVREKLAEFLPEYLNNKQMALFVTDKEYEGLFKEKIDYYVGKKYLLASALDNDDETRVIKC
ncbi:AAA family ATPase [Methanosphaera sp. ISO3-F5]|uniref:AAA family ATPase n=1 Tax=Methanosphaera sp. ISO3-F5 TaxID=1452353 RepID=UPI002B260DF6|nr:AAA family ATPase [Methanosphaera sp. ISO3-F5]WQH63905.1 AAA family ATPase [Methanosphaera sp. ISO3-F5]